MIITKSQLKQIIQEEMEKLLNEQSFADFPYSDPAEGAEIEAAVADTRAHNLFKLLYPGQAEKGEYQPIGNVPIPRRKLPRHEIKALIRLRREDAARARGEVVPDWDVD